MNDPIIDEIRRIRDAHAARFNYDLDAIYRDIKEQEKASGRTFINFAAVDAEPKPSLQATGDTLLVSPATTSPEAAER